MDPQTLAAYLAVLPPTVFQLELRSGDFEIKLNIGPAVESPANEPTTGLPVDGVSEIPEELLAYFPKAKRKDLVGEG